MEQYISTTANDNNVIHEAHFGAHPKAGVSPPIVHPIWIQIWHHTTQSFRQPSTNRHHSVCVRASSHHKLGTASSEGGVSRCDDGGMRWKGDWWQGGPVFKMASSKKIKNKKKRAGLENKWSSIQAAVHSVVTAAWLFIRGGGSRYYWIQMLREQTAACLEAGSRGPRRSPLQGPREDNDLRMPRLHVHLHLNSMLLWVWKGQSKLQPPIGSARAVWECPSTMR